MHATSASLGGFNEGSMITAAPLIVWFREDLRLADNPALSHAAQTGQPVVALYILDETPGVRRLGGASRWWLDKSLASLAEGLRTTLGGRLILRRGKALPVLKSLVEETGATGVCWNRLYDSGAITRDKAIKSDLMGAGVTCVSFNAALLNEPWTVTKADGKEFRVFTPYWNAARGAADAVQPTPSAAVVNWFARETASDDLADWGLHPRSPDWSTGFLDWRPGESGALAQLDAFLSGGAAGYATRRDFPADPATSRLSPHLHFGEIGPRQVFAAAARAAITDHAIAGDAETFEKELGWREFNHHILFHHPDIPTRNFRDAFDDFPWREDPGALEAWKRGRTGYPIVDAGMRQLWTSGWMHNRVRMIVASFLTKHLLIDWREGEAWFWDTLVDADLANNVANWQWVAGSGADAAPYFRVFNPVLQGAKYDPDGDYVRRWVPEIAALPNAFIHKPWDAGEEILRSAGVRLGSTYPAPIVDHAVARERALGAYRGLGASLPSGRERAA
jgi:deoxyribodipyrimidine photo-lyase